MQFAAVLLAFRPTSPASFSRHPPQTTSPTASYALNITCAASHSVTELPALHIPCRFRRQPLNRRAAGGSVTNSFAPASRRHATSGRSPQHLQRTVIFYTGTSFCGRRAGMADSFRRAGIRTDRYRRTLLLCVVTGQTAGRPMPFQQLFQTVRLLCAPSLKLRVPLLPAVGTLPRPLTTSLFAWLHKTNCCARLSWRPGVGTARSL